MAVGVWKVPASRANMPLVSCTKAMQRILKPRTKVGGRGEGCRDSVFQERVQPQI